MTLSVSEQCRSCLVTLQEVISILSQPDHINGHVKYAQVNEELDRFSLFVGNIGALHRPESSMSIESRLHEANDVLTHILSLLSDLNEVAAELLEIVSGKREGMISVDEQIGEEISEVDELREEISGTITRLFRVSILIRQAAPTDLFAKALSRNRYCFNDQFDIAHVGEKYRKLGTNDYAWLRQRLGRAITQRRHYLSYIQDHHEKLGGMLIDYDKADSSAARSQAPNMKQPLASKPMLDTASRPSFFTKATTVAPERIAPQLLVAEGSDSGDDARSYTTISRSIDGGHEPSTTVRIPKLDDLRIGNKKEIECPFCFRIKKFKSERTWRKHVFSDLRAYVCTFPDCDAPYFGDINKWFQHEMMFHRVAYECFLCPNTVFYREQKYLSHLKREHAKMLFDGGEQPGRDLARKPLAQIPADDCPCCSDWADRLKERIIQTSGSAPTDILAVVPTVFKRHLAGHLEQLALFAIPIGVATDDDNNSNAAIEEEKSKRTDASQLPTLTFASSRGNLDDASPGTEADPSKSEVLHADIQVPEIKAGPKNEAPGSPPSQPSKLGDQDGADHSSTLASMVSLASTCRNEGRWRDAEELEVQVVGTSKRVLGPEHPDTLASMHNLALALYSQGKYREAEAMCKETLALRKKVLGPEHPDTLASMSILARALDEQVNYEEAESIYRQTLALREKVLGPEHPDTLANMYNLALALGSQGKYKEAEAMCKETLALREKVLGPKHPDTLTSVSQLGSVLSRHGNQEAEAMYRRVLEGSEEVFGPEHLSTLTSVSQLGSVLLSQGKYQEAEAMYQRALEGYKKVLGPEHPYTLTSVSQLGSVLARQGKYEEAEAIHRRALEESEKVLGLEHPDTLTSMANLASTFWSQSRWTEAENLEVRVMEIRKRVLGDKHPATLTAMGNLASTLKSQNRNQEALILLQTCVHIQTQVLGGQHPDTKSSLKTLAKWQKES